MPSRTPSLKACEPEIDLDADIIIYFLSTPVAPAVEGQHAALSLRQFAHDTSLL